MQQYKKNPDLKNVLVVLITIVIVGCASHKKVNKLASHLICDKEVHFTFAASNNDIMIEKKGWYMGDSRVPEFDDSFRRSLEELVRYPELKLKFKKTHETQSDSIDQVNVKIDSIIWNFGFSSATMETFLNYELPDQSIKVVGKNKVYLHGTKKGNLYKSLKNGNYWFLSKFCHE